MMEVILKVKEEDLDYILKQFLVLNIKVIKIKRKTKQRVNKSLSLPSTYNEPDQ